MTPAGKFIFGITSVGTLTTAANLLKYKNVDYSHPYFQRGLEASLYSPSIKEFVGERLKCSILQASRISDGKLGKIAVRVEGEKGSGTLFISGMRNSDLHEEDEESISWYEHLYNTATKTPFILKEKILSFFSIRSKALEFMEEINALDKVKSEEINQSRGFSSGFRVVDVERQVGDVTPVLLMSQELSLFDKIRKMFGFFVELPPQSVDLEKNSALSNPAACPASNILSNELHMNPNTSDWNVDCILFVPEKTIFDENQQHIIPIFGNPLGSPFYPQILKNDKVVYKNESRLNIVKWIVLGGGSLMILFSSFSRIQASRLKVRPINFARRFALNHPDVHAVFEASSSLPPLPVYQDILSKPKPIVASSLVRTGNISAKNLQVASISLDNKIGAPASLSEVGSASLDGIRTANVKLTGPDGREGEVSLWLSSKRLKVIKANMKMGERTFELNTGGSLIENGVL